jgi:hypothetical protein
MNKVLGFVCLVLFNALLLAKFPDMSGLIYLWCFISGGVYGVVSASGQSRAG